jgi:hypothetical protein
MADVRYIRFPLENGKTGLGAVYKPVNLTPGKRYPVVFLIPGINTPHTAMENLASELARRNYYVFSVFAPKWNPPKNLKTLRRAMEYVYKNYPEAYPKKTAFVGQSLGGTTAVDASYNNKSACAAVSIGFYIGGELKTQPPNLLLGTGMYDDLNSPDKMKQSIRSVTNNKLTEEGRIGYFKNRTVRQLFFSPYSGHCAEMADPYIAGKIAEFLSLSIYGVPEKDKFISFPFYKISIMILLAGSLLSAIPLVMFLSGRYEYHYRFIFLPLILIAGLILVFAPLNPVAVIRIFGILFLSFLISNYYMKKYENHFVQAYKGFLVFFIRTFAVVVLFAFSFIVSQFIFEAGMLFSSGKYLYAFPGYIMVTFPLAICNFMVSSILFIKQAASWIYIFPILLCLFLYFMETMSAGWCLHSIFKKADELRRFAKFRKERRPSKKMMIILIICTAAAIAAWFWLLSAGLLKLQIMKDYILFILRYLAIPLTLTLLIRYRIKKATGK